MSAQRHAQYGPSCISRLTKSLIRYLATATCQSATSASLDLQGYGEERLLADHMASRFEIRCILQFPYDSADDSSVRGFDASRSSCAASKAYTV